MRFLRLAILLTTIPFGFASSSNAQTTAILDGPGVPVRPGFKTYSLFLMCNPDWLLNDSDANVASLFSDFKVFGAAIGDDNLAVWFWKHPGVGVYSPATASAIDFPRSINFCKKWQLAPSKGPYLVITSQYPDERHLGDLLPQDSAVFALGAAKREDIDKLLVSLSDQLLLTNKVPIPPPAPAGAPTPAQPAAPPPARLPWSTRLLEAVQQSINQAGCEWTFKLQTGAVDATVHACVTQPT